MDSIKSIRFSLRKVILAIWIFLLLGAIAVALWITLPTALKYKHYIEGQDIAIAITLENTDEFDDYEYKDDRESLVLKLYSFYNPYPLSYNINGVNYNNTDIVKSAQELDLKFGELMKAAGFTCRRGSEYLEHSTFKSYANEHITGEIAYATTVGILILAMLLITISYALENRKEIVISESAVVWKNTPKKIVSILIKDITSVETTPVNGLRIKGANFSYTAFLIKNNTELFAELSSKIDAIKASDTNIHSNADEIEKYKSLLDKGVISQEEFEAKKKQLLGL